MAPVIKTKMVRRYRSPQLDQFLLIQCIYVDRPASVDTWVENCGMIAAEFGMSWTDAHLALVSTLPEIF